MERRAGASGRRRPSSQTGEAHPGRRSGDGLPGLSRGIATALVALGALAAVLYAAAVGYLYFNQRAYVFHPSANLGTPATNGLPGVQAVTLRMRDGVDLTAWRAEAAVGQPTVLYFQGNAGSLADRAGRFRQIVASGFGLLALSYRGFAGSGGSPSEAALFSDALETFDRLTAETDDIVVHGESLGTGIAAYVAANRQVRALVLEAPYTAALDIAAASYPWVPVSYLMRDPFLTRDYIRRVSAPVLIVHGTSDSVIPVEHGRKLYAIANEPKQLAIIEGGSHGDLWERGLWPIVLRFLQANHVGALAALVTPPTGSLPSSP